MAGESPTFRHGIVESQANGLGLIVKIAENFLREENQNIKDIQTVIAQEHAIYKKNNNGMSAPNVESDLQPIILNAFIVLKDVLTSLSTETKKKELQELVSIADRFLGQDFVPRPFIATANVWLRDIKKLSPDFSPILWAVKPPEGSYKDNMLKWAVGAVNVNECRILGQYKWRASDSRRTSGASFTGGSFGEKPHELGRFPANVILDEEAGRLLDEQSGIKKTSGQQTVGKLRGHGIFGQVPDGEHFGDSGGASRFFYTAKSGRAERAFYCRDCQCAFPQDARPNHLHGHYTGDGKEDWSHTTAHPTVKPIALFEWLIKLVTRQGQIVLDPFLGSGTTMIAAYKAGRKCVGIEKEPEYIEIAKRRVKHSSYQMQIEAGVEQE